MEKRASEDIVSLNSESFKRCKKCGAVENEFLYDREQPDFTYSNTAFDEGYDWGMDFTGYEDMGMDGDYMPREDMDVPEMYPEQMMMGQMDMPQMYQEQMAMGQMDMPQMYQEQMAMGQMNMPEMYPEQMTMPHMSMHQMEMPYMGTPQLGTETDNMYYGMSDMTNPYMGMEMSPEQQIAPGMEYQSLDQMFQIMAHMLEEIINREARIMRLIGELKEYQK